MKPKNNKWQVYFGKQNTRMTRLSYRALNKAIFSLVFVFLLLAGISLCRTIVRGKIVAYNTYFKEISTKDECPPAYRIGIAANVADKKAWLSKMKYYNSCFIIGVFIPDGIENLK